MTESGSFWVGTTEAPATYQLDALLGGGGEGEVWRGVLPLSDAGRRLVAIKIMRGAVEGEDPAEWQRFGHLLRSLAHPGLVRVTDVFIGPPPHRQDDPATDELCRYVVMDYVDGPTLRDWVDENPAATAAGRLALLRTAASALDEMHSGSRTEVPVAHGDVKPANIIVGPTGGTVLVDLGLARLADGQGVSGRSNPYAAPELRTADAQATPEADAFAFAATASHVLTGQAPPTDAAGLLDLAALQVQLQTSPVTQRRPMLVHQVLAVLSAAPAARPTQLRLWLDAAADTLSQITTPPAADAGPVPGEVVLGPEDQTHVPGRRSPASSPARTRTSHRKRNVLLSSLVVVLVLALGGAAFALTQNHGKKTNAQTTITPPPSTSSSDTPSPTDSSTPTDSASDSPSDSESDTASDTSSPTDSTTQSSDQTDPSPSSSDTGLPTNTVNPPTTQWVSSMGAVDYDGDSRQGSSLTESGSYDTNGRTYAHSLRMRGGCYNQDGGDYWNEYDLARQWSILTAVIGMEDDSPSGSSMGWAIYGDGKLLATGTQSIGNSRAIKISVKNVLRLRIKVNDQSTVNSCPNNLAFAVFGNVELTA